MNQFRKVIRNWEDWEATAGEISAFSGVVEKIFHNEGLPAADIRKLPPSTNAVFRVGDYVGGTADRAVCHVAGRGSRRAGA